MIQPNEIRIGNYLLTPRKQFFKVKTISLDLLHDSEDDYVVNYFNLDECSPIQLTEEILLKCGEKYNNSGFNLGKFKVLKSTEGVFIIPTNNKLVQIYFVHDLQNFYYYYENTKTELIINL